MQILKPMTNIVVLVAQPVVLVSSVSVDGVKKTVPKDKKLAAIRVLKHRAIAPTVVPVAMLVQEHRSVAKVSVFVPQEPRDVK